MAFRKGEKWTIEEGESLVETRRLLAMGIVMLCIEFTEEERKALHHERFHHPHPRVQQKMEALWLKSHNLPHAQIAELVQISEETLRAYLRAYQEEGIEKLKTISWQGPESELSPQQSTLKDFFCKIRQRLPLTRQNRLKS